MVESSQAKSSSPVPAGLPINWGLITGPVQPVLSPSLSTQLPPPQSSAVHALQTKVKSLTQRRTRARDREKERDRLDTEVLLSNPPGQISPEVLLRQRPRAKAPLPHPSSSWRSGVSKVLSSSDEEEEVEVQVRLEIHSPPAEVQAERGLQVGEDTEEERSEENPTQLLGLTGGTSLESLLSDHSSSSRDEPSPLPPLPVFSTCPITTAASTTTSSSSSSTSSTSTRHWAPPKGFWRVARPETLLLNGVGPNNMPSTLPVKDYTQIETTAEPPKDSKPVETGATSDTAPAVQDDSDASSEFKHSDSVECYLDRCEQKEAESKGLCSSDSWESTSSQSGWLSADEKLRVKQRAYARLRERQHNCREEREQSGGEGVIHHEDVTSRVDCKGGSLEEDVV